mgnify:CR=1 FL=1
MNYYFHKSAYELNLAEASILVGIPKSPNNYSPISNYENAKSYRLVAEYKGTKFYENNVTAEGKIEGRIENIPYDVFDFVIYATVSGEGERVFCPVYISVVVETLTARIKTNTTKISEDMVFALVVLAGKFRPGNESRIPFFPFFPDTGAGFHSVMICD